MSASLEWPILDRFVRYVEALPDGEIEVTQISTTRDSFLFPFVERDEGILRFSGIARFSGHSGMLDVRIGNPELIVEGRRAFVVIDDDDDPAHARMTLASGDTTVVAHADGECVSVARPRLTDEGADLFNGAYAAGTEMASLAAFVPRYTPAASPTEQGKIPAIVKLTRGVDARSI